MSNRALLRLIIGFRRFRNRFLTHTESLEKLSSGQSPKSLVIGCSDSRVDPALWTSAAPGEMFVVRNVANLVPPFESANGYHGVSSAIEFAIVNLKVENVIVLGHRQCGGIRALMQGETKQGGFVHAWVQIARAAKDRVLARYPDADADTQCRHCEMESIIESISNLRTFPFVREAIAERGLRLIGAYFDIERGEIFELEDNNHDFRRLPI